MEKCFLETEGYRISFDLSSRGDNQGYLDVAIEFLLDPHLGQMAVKSKTILLSLEEFERLVHYFEQHIACLEQAPDHESTIFVPMELGFQFQALSGEVRSPDDGEFSLICLVNIGPSREEGSSVYVGGEAVVTLRQIQMFVNSLRTTLAQLSLVRAGAERV